MCTEGDFFLHTASDDYYHSMERCIFANALKHQLRARHAYTYYTGSN